MRRRANHRRRHALLAILSLLALVLCTVAGMHASNRGPLLQILSVVAASGLAWGVMVWWAPGLLDTYPRHKFWRILLESAPPILLYMLAIEAGPEVVSRLPEGWIRVAAALVPALLVAWAMFAFARYVGMLDELQQRLELQSLALAAGLVCIAGAAAGFLHLSGIASVPGKAGLWAFPLLGMGYGLIRTILTRRYQ